MTDMIDQSRRLLEGLYLKTNQQKIEWKFDQVASVCEASIGNGYVQIVQETDDDGDYYSFVRVLNWSRDVIDTIYGGSLGKDNAPVNTGHENYFYLIRDLYSAAKRSALGADKVVNSIIVELGVAGLSLDEPPF